MDLPPRLRHFYFSYLPQTPLNASHITLLQAMHCALAHTSDMTLSTLLRHLSSMGLDNQANNYLDELSGGQRQRYAIAQVLAQPAPLIFLDEPLNNLDPKHQFSLLRKLKIIARKERKIILLTLHDLNLALRFCPYSLLIKNGEKIACGATPSVLTPRNIYEAFDIHVAQETSQSGIHFLALPEDPPDIPALDPMTKG